MWGYTWYGRQGRCHRLNQNLMPGLKTGLMRPLFELFYFLLLLCPEIIFSADAGRLLLKAH
jgi:hypothetical protein